MSTELFRDRADAGNQLARKLRHLPTDSLVLALPRGGVPVAIEVAQSMRWPLDVVVARKLGVPWQRELAMGAVCEDDVTVMNEDVVTQCRITEDQILQAVQRERATIAERAARFRAGRGAPSLRGKCVVIVDDGVATGATAKAACRYARKHGAARVVVAVPVAPAGWEHDFVGLADDCVDVMAPPNFASVGNWYSDFSEVTDDDVMHGLATFHTEEIRSSFVVRVDDVTALAADVVVPPRAAGCVIFVHGSGSGRLSPRNRHVANVLNKGGLATVLFDLLTEEESQDRDNVFDIELLTQRLVSVIWWVRRQDWAKTLRLGLFGASTGAAAALTAAARLHSDVDAVVSRGGRPDMAEDVLPQVRCPVLLIVGSMDHTVLQLNRKAQRRLSAPHALVEVTGATHLFEESGTLDIVAAKATDFFTQHLGVRAAIAAG